VELIEVEDELVLVVSNLEVVGVAGFNHARWRIAGSVPRGGGRKARVRSKAIGKRGGPVSQAL
jgi:hypothetical protein